MPVIPGSYAVWEAAAPELGLEQPFIDEAMARAGGNMQHAAMLRKHLASVPPAKRRVEGIPRGLAALLASAWKRIASERAAVDGLGILCAAREALTLDELGAVAGWASEAPRRAFVRGARELLLERNRNDDVSEYRLRHDSIRAQAFDRCAAICWLVACVIPAQATTSVRHGDYSTHSIGTSRRSGPLTYAHRWSLPRQRRAQIPIAWPRRSAAQCKLGLLKSLPGAAPMLCCTSSTRSTSANLY